jgi:hypothetical protein
VHFLGLFSSESRPNSFSMKAAQFPASIVLRLFSIAPAPQLLDGYLHNMGDYICPSHQKENANQPLSAPAAMASPIQGDCPHC